MSEVPHIRNDEEGSEFISEPVLAFETSGRLTGVALMRDGRLVAESSVDVGAGREESLLDLADTTLRRHALGVRDLARIAVSIGPGSFTGIRVGVAAAQHLAFGADLAIAPVSSHHALALPFRAAPGRVIILTGVRKGQVFTEVGKWCGHDWVSEFANQSIPVEELPTVLERTDSSTIFAGEAVSQLAERFPEVFAKGSCAKGPLDLARRPGPVAVLGARRSQPLKRGLDVDQLEPLYLRAADAKKPTLRTASGKLVERAAP